MTELERNLITLSSELNVLSNKAKVNSENPDLKEHAHIFKGESFAYNIAATRIDNILKWNEVII